MKKLNKYQCSYCTQVFDDAERCEEHEENCGGNRDKYKTINATQWATNFSLATGQYEKPSAYVRILYQDAGGNYYEKSCGTLTLLDYALDVPQVSPGQYSKYRVWMVTTRRGTTSIKKELVNYLNNWAKERAQNIIDNGMIQTDFVREV